MSDLYHAVRCALEKDDRQYLKTIEADLKRQIEAAAKRSTEELLSELNNRSFCLARNFAAESYIPKSVQKTTKTFCTALR